MSTEMVGAEEARVRARIEDWFLASKAAEPFGRGLVAPLLGVLAPQQVEVLAGAMAAMHMRGWMDAQGLPGFAQQVLDAGMRA